MDSASPYERVLGARLAELTPALQRYFAPIPPGHIGVGSGTFEVVGTRHAWMNPLLRIVGVVPSGWHENVPFRVENRTEAGRQTARRVFALPSGDFVMTDAVHTSASGALVDVIGTRVAAAFDASPHNGGLRLRSWRVAVRFGPLRITIPRWIAPVVTVDDRSESGSDRQLIDLEINAPIVGRVYQYRGSFTYEIREQA